MMFEDQDCITCFMQFKVPAGFTAARRKDGRSFHCPNGHSMSYPLGESEADKMRRERDQAIQRVAEYADAAREAERKTAAAKKELSKIKKRAAAGLCPVCNRNFVALGRHIHTKHPAFTADEHVH